MQVNTMPESMHFRLVLSMDVVFSFFVSRLFSIDLIFVLSEIIHGVFKCVKQQGWTAFFASSVPIFSYFSFFVDACFNVVNIICIQIFSLWFVILAFCFWMIFIEHVCICKYFVNTNLRQLIDNSDSFKKLCQLIVFQIFQAGHIWKFNTILRRIYREENRSVQHIIQFTVRIPNDNGVLLCDYIYRFLDNVSGLTRLILLSFNFDNVEFVLIFFFAFIFQNFNKPARPNRIAKVSSLLRVANRCVLTNYFAHGILVYQIENQRIWSTRISTKNCRQI